MRGAAWIALFLAAAGLRAEVTVSAIANSAHYLPGTLYGVARGSLAVIFGSGLGPPGLELATYPLRAELAGTSARITSGGQTVDALVVYSSYNQVAVVVPSRTPAGMASVVVRSMYGESFAGWVKVVDRSPGIYTASSDGLGLGSITSAQYEAKTFEKPARAGETLVLWLTGLGAVAGDESAPLPGPLAGDVSVYVGDQPARISYAGRSGCCAGLDQVNFEVPAGVTGCLVPVMLAAAGEVSNSVLLPVSAAGQPCTDPVGPSAAVLERTVSGQPLAGGVIFVGPAEEMPWRVHNLVLHAPFQRTPDAQAAARDWVRLHGLPKTVGQRRAAMRELKRFVEAQAPAYGAWAAFGQVNGLGTAITPAAAVVPSPGYCMLTRLPARAAVPHPRTAMLDAGPQLALIGPTGSVVLRKTKTGQYEGRIGRFADGLPEGSYTVTGDGGVVGPMIARLPTGVAPRWLDKPAVMDRAAPLTIHWTAAAQLKYVLFGGAAEYGNVGSAFLCAADAKAGTLTVPPAVLAAMPPTNQVYLFLTPHPYENPFQSAGLDLGYIANLSYDWAEVPVK